MRLYTLFLPTSNIAAWAIALIMSTSSNALSATSTSTSSSTVVSELCLHPAAKNIVVPPENIVAIQDLEPRALWTQFAILSSIPRASKQEGAALQYIKDFAKHHKLTWKQDAVGNLVVFHPGTIGHGGQVAATPAIILQGHVDMVTEKNSDKQHNFETDPILLRRFTKKSKHNDGEPHEKHWLGAQGTTLGADNGIGVAAALALLQTPTDDSTMLLALPPLEALFTIDEETGLTGATNLDAQALGLTGKTMLNLDTEEWGELYVGCAGGGESTIQLSLERFGKGAFPEHDDFEVKLVQIKVEGLMGGHSGINIHEGRANAVLLCAAVTRAALLANIDGVHLVSITGGDKHNAIPREARAFLLLLNDHAKSNVESVVENFQNSVMAEYGGLEKNARISLIVEEEKKDMPRPLEEESANRLLSVLLSLPHGPVKFSHAMPDLVETSNNVASLTMSDDDDTTTATILCSTRSSISSALEATRDRLAAVAFLAGASIERSPAYPGWNPNMESPVLHLAKKLLAKRLGGDESHHDHHHDSPGVKAIHAGLECGLLIEKLGGNVDALSFGPTIVGAHSPDESILTDTVPPFFNLVQDILSELAKKQRSSSS
jgi:dipeptidase D